MTTPGRRRRFRPTGLERLESELSERDRAILSDLGRVRLLTGQLIARLHFFGLSPLTQARRCRAVLQRLFDLGLLVRLERRVGGVRAGSAGHTFGLSVLGQRIVTGKGPAGGDRLRQPWEPSAIFAAHVLAVAELYVCVSEAVRSLKRLELVRFDAEPAAWRVWHATSGERLVLKPDTFVIVADEVSDRLSFVEVDRSTESLRVIGKKARIFIDYWRSGTEQEREGAFPMVLFVVLDEHRKDGVVATLAQLDPEAWQLFQVVVGVEAAVAALLGRSPPAVAGGDRDAI